MPKICPNTWDKVAQGTGIKQHLYRKNDGREAAFLHAILINIYKILILIQNFLLDPALDLLDHWRGLFRILYIRFLSLLSERSTAAIRSVIQFRSHGKACYHKRPS